MLARVAANAAGADRHDGDVSRDVAALREAGWLRACLPPQAGGEGWGCTPGGTAPALRGLRELGRANLTVARLFEGHMNAVKLIALYGSAVCRERVFTRVADGALLGVWGADALDDPVTLQQTDECLTLTGAKRFASGLGMVAEAVISAPHPGGGVQLVLVPATDPDRADSASWRMAGMRATRSGTYSVAGLPVEEERLLGAPDDYFREPHFEGGIWRYCAAHGGAAERLYELMRDALTARGRADDAMQQARIVQAAIAVETARLWIARAAEAVEADGARPGAATLSLLAREVTERSCREMLALVEQALGMAAHEEGTAVERIRRDLALFLCQAAPDAKRARAARALVETGVLPEEL